MICDWLGERDEAGVAKVVDSGEEARLSTLAGGGDAAGACEAGGVDEPEDAAKPYAI